MSTPKQGDYCRVGDLSGLGEWYLGEIIKVYETHNSTNVDVQLCVRGNNTMRSYNINEIELISQADPSWLLGLAVHIPLKRTDVLSGTISSVIPGGTIQIEYTLSETTKVRNFTFEEVIHQLILDAKENRELTVNCSDSALPSKEVAVAGNHEPEMVVTDSKLGSDGTIDSKNEETVDASFKPTKDESQYTESGDAMDLKAQSATILAPAALLTTTATSKVATKGSDRVAQIPNQASDISKICVGSRLSIDWDGTNQFEGVIVTQLETSGDVTIKYDDTANFDNDAVKIEAGKSELIDLASVHWRLENVADKKQLAHVRVGSRVSVFWANYGVFFSGVVRQRVNNEEFKIEYDDGDFGCYNLMDYAFHFLDDSATTATKKKKASKKAIADTRFCIINKRPPDVLAVRESGDLKRPARLPDEDYSHFKECPHSKRFDDSFHSAMADRGMTFKVLTIDFNERIPNKESRQTLLNMVMHGPTTDAGIMFPECHRLELCMTLLKEHLLVLPGFPALIAKELPPKYVDECLEQVMQPIYAVPGDAVRMNGDAITRIGQSLHMKSCSVDLLRFLLEYEYKRCCDSTERAGVSDQRTLLRSILCRRNGPKDVLKLSVVALVNHWIYHGHFIIGQTRFLSLKEGGPTARHLDVCREHGRELAFQMGNVCSYLTWMYCMDANESSKDAAILISNLVLKAIKETKFDPTPFLEKCRFSVIDYWERVKLDLLMSFDPKVVPQLRPLLADRFGMGYDYNVINFLK
jgi:hypothetical protein